MSTLFRPQKQIW